eukprot:6540149-Prymnesium_polylepis.1
MKMLITIKAGESGKINHALNPGAIINAGDLLASLTLKDPSKVKKILPFDGELLYETGDVKEETTLQGYRSSLASLMDVMDGYPIESEPLVQKMLLALSSYKLLIEEVVDAAAALGNKLPAELDAKLQTAYAAADADHVAGQDSSEVASIVASITSIIDEFIGAQYESKQADIRAVVAPVTAVLA